MGLLRKAHQRHGRRLRSTTRVSTTAGPLRVCRFEQMEPRRLLAFAVVPIQVGAVYFEDSIGADQSGDLFEITWTGGAPGTQLTRLLIETDKHDNGLTEGDTFFDTELGGLGASGAVGAVIVDQTGIDSVHVEVVDGGMTLLMTFSGFDPGEKLVFSVDVDEQGFLNPNPVAEGAEFEGSRMSPTFAADHFFEKSGTDIFLDDYDHKLDGSGLDLPRNDYDTDPPLQDRTAAAIFSLVQDPLPITVAGTVFEDVNADNSQGSGEPGLEDVELKLYVLEGGQYVATAHTTRTDANGDYLFEDVLPGVYRIVETQPDGYMSVGASAGTVGGQPRGEVAGDDPDAIFNLQLLGGDESVDNDFAETQPAKLSGNVYHDVDNDGVFDDGETGIGGVLIVVQYIEPSVNPLQLNPVTPVLSPQAETTTNPDGSWSLGNLMPGNYQITEVQPGGYSDGLDTAGTAGGTEHNPGDLIDDVWLPSGRWGQEYNFGELLPASISGHVIDDYNANGLYDPGETPIAGVTVHLLDAAGDRIRSMQTDPNGEYSFTGLLPGVYGVEEIHPAGYLDGADLVGSEGGMPLPPDSIIGVTLVSGTEAVDYDFLEILPASISGRVVVDVNENCTFDQGDVALGGVTVYLLDAIGNRIDSTTTDANGEYAFTNLTPGVYGVEEIQPEGYFDGGECVGSEGGRLQPPDSIVDAELFSGTDAVNYNFRELEPVSLSGHVYVDDNNNGVRDAGEEGIADVQLTLLDASGVATAITVATNSVGYYRLDGLEPNKIYGVAETQPDGFYDGLDAAGTAGGVAHNPGDSITDVLLPPQAVAQSYDFGELRPASISGRVHAELTGNCTFDPGEPLLEGVTIHLLDASGERIKATTTDSAGEYSFGNLPPGTYGVEEIQPPGYFDGSDKVGSAGGRLDGNDRIVEADLGPGVDAIDYNFCELLPARISGYVFQDGPTVFVFSGQPVPDPATVRDGRFTPDDTPIAGVQLRLGDASGAPLLAVAGISGAVGNDPFTTVTDANGYYEFTNLEPGIYTVLEIHPAKYLDGIDSAGSHGGIAVNAHEAIDPMILSQLAIDPANDAILRIRLNPGDVANSYNFSEVLVEDRPLIPPVVPDPDPDPRLPPPSNPLPQPYRPVYLYYALPVALHTVPPAGGGAIPITHTWHLSVINGGRPRRDQGDEGPHFTSIAWTRTDMDQSRWVIADDEGEREKEIFFGAEDAIPVTGDWDGDGVTDVGVFINGHWFLDLNGNGVWDKADLWVRLGKEGDLPVTGDWDGDGKTDIGIFGPIWKDDPRAIETEPGLPDVANTPGGPHKNIPPEGHEATNHRRDMKRTSRGTLRSDVIDHVFQYGSERDVPVAGDFNGDGVATIGVFRDGAWFLDLDGNGRWSADDVLVELGVAGDVPVVGDFNGDGVDELGVYRAGTWYLDTDGNRVLDAHDKVFELGGPHDKPIVGDFNGDGVDQIGIYQDTAAPQPQQQAAR